MIDESAHPAGHPDMDYEEHERTYQMFLKLMKYAVIGSVTVLIVLALLWG